MSGWRDTSTMSGVRMHWEQSSVGKVSDRRAMLPPSDGSRSTSTTGKPALAMSSAARIPATPPPITRPRFVTGTSTGFRARACFTRSTVAATIRHALAVAWSWFGWTQEHCSRMLAISHWNGLSPAWDAAARKVGSWSCGEQAATTTPVRSCSLIASARIFCPGAEQK
jgi:hypothetical protein